ncbi:MAG: hypothetical protein ACP5SI_08870 [Chloroflexia bacterium]
MFRKAFAGLQVILLENGSRAHPMLIFGGLERLLALDLCPARGHGHRQVLQHGDAPLTNVYGCIGNGSTPGTYPTRDSANDPEFQPGQKWDYLHNSGLYAFRHLGPTSDATRYIGTIPAGECRYQYGSFEYPACENLGGTWQEPPCAAGTDPLWGPSIKPDETFRG